MSSIPTRLAPLAMVAFFATVCQSYAQTRDPAPPTYSAATILNAASGVPDSYAPYSLISIHGENLSSITASIDFEAAQEVPVIYGSSGTRVWFRNQPLGLLYVSATEIVALFPPDVFPSTGVLQITSKGIAGPAVPITVRKLAPALFLQAEGVVAASKHEDGRNVSIEEPASPGDTVVLYGTGFGATKPVVSGLSLLKRSAPVNGSVQVFLDGLELDPALVEYVGVHPGLAGTYQVRLRLPSDVADDPEVRVVVDGESTQEGLRIPVRTSAVVVVPESYSDPIR
jgi:uncharacterized protein (TIGR03437 family)